MYYCYFFFFCFFLLKQLDKQETIRITIYYSKVLLFFCFSLFSFFHFSEEIFQCGDDEGWPGLPACSTQKYLFRKVEKTDQDKKESNKTLL